jgi:BirA family biotin operon repressor/biotin-[acetyl-CoA-carboxylase] ligase
MNEIHLDSIDSTNTYAKQHFSSFPPNTITCITAEEQTAGRGRYDRKWVSPRGVNLYVTFYFRLPATTLHLGCLGHVIALSLSKVLIQNGFHPKIKWPNDLLVSRKKISGVLCETQFKGPSVDVFLGIGINVNLDQKTASSIDQPATSMMIETNHSWNRKEVLQALQKQLSHDLATFKQTGFASFHSTFEALLAYKGERVRVFDGQRTWEGVCHSVTIDGQLNLLLPDHTLQKLATGDILLG